ncbi:uncharacterized protein MG328-like [Gigantopelta aegis]|uniref:uncharacterized protein MG328-like n=1 Tax=Gigantopelta aegis TaxID=1735272 RepID=UPI001B88E270|nr:uncharacterized protein MG328-like [Gigantopelta aegis]
MDEYKSAKDQFSETVSVHLCLDESFKKAKYLIFLDVKQPRSHLDWEPENCEDEIRDLEKKVNDLKDRLKKETTEKDQKTKELQAMAENKLEEKPNLAELIQHVRVGSKWHLLGVLLELDEIKLNDIRRMREGSDFKALKMFQLWLKTNPNATRRQVIDALKKEPVKEMTVADNYEKILQSEPSGTIIENDTEVDDYYDDSNKKLENAKKMSRAKTLEIEKYRVRFVQQQEKERTIIENDTEVDDYYDDFNMELEMLKKVSRAKTQETEQYQVTSVLQGKEYQDEDDIKEFQRDSFNMITNRELEFSTPACQMLQKVNENFIAENTRDHWNFFSKKDEVKIESSASDDEGVSGTVSEEDEESLIVTQGPAKKRRVITDSDNEEEDC